MSEEQKHERFGKYLILDHLVDGGMAKICRARFVSEQADRVFAIKMVQPQFSKDPEFIKMFENEVALSFKLVHPNIAQTTDAGEYNGQLYTAMEYVDGKNIKEYIDKLKSINCVFPVPIAVSIIAQAAIGLHYAHTLKDQMSGKPLDIVHRDISPHNIMLTYDGAVKIIDFGIAKSTVNTEQTQAGMIKGKISYIAPEYLESKKLDGRYDEFALAVTLWEMLCSRKLFKGKNQLAVLKLIQECKVPAPSTINPHISKDLDNIIMKALSRERSDRYENCDQFNRDLVKHLYQEYPNFNLMDLRKFAQGLFKDEIKKDKAKFYEFGKIDIKPYLEDLKREQNEGHSDSHAEQSFESSSNSTRESRIIDFGFNNEEDSGVFNKTNTDSSVDLSSPDGNVLAWDQVRHGQRGGDRTATSISNRTVATRVTNARILKGEQRKKEHKAKMKKLYLGVLVAAAMIAIFVGPMRMDINNFKYLFTDRPDPIVLQQQNRQAAEKHLADVDMIDSFTESAEATQSAGVIRFKNLRPLSQRVYINGKLEKPSILSEIEYPYSDSVVLRVEENGKLNYVKKFILSKDNAIVDVEIPDMPKVSYGYVRMSNNCVFGKLYVTISGEDRVIDLPIEGRGIAFPLNNDDMGRPVPTEYSVYYVVTGEDGIERATKIKIESEDDIVDFCDFIPRGF